MSCGVPLSSYSRFRQQPNQEPNDNGMRMAGIIIIVVAVAAVLICWCNSRKTSSCGRAGRRHIGAGEPIECENFKQFQEVTNGPRACVMAFADWCGHCQKCKPAFAQAARMSTVPFFLVNIEKVFNQEQMKQYGIEGFPTFLLFSKGQVLKTHTGGRSASDFAQFAAQ